MMLKISTTRTRAGGSTRARENALAGGTSARTTVLAARMEGCSAGTQCTKNATRGIRRMDMAALECATTSTPSQEKAIHATLTIKTRIVPGATRMVINASRTHTLGQAPKREAAAKQGPSRGTASPSKAIASTLLNATPMPLARRKRVLASIDSIGNVNVTRDGGATESNVWTATAHSALCPGSKLRLLLMLLLDSIMTHMLRTSSTTGTR